MSSILLDIYIIQWVNDCLKDQAQIVVVNEEASGWQSVTSGVCQGSDLGLHLFIVFINDLDTGVERTQRRFPAMLN